MTSLYAEHPAPTHNPFEDLALAVIIRAVYDYRNLRRKLATEEHEIDKHLIQEKLKEIRRFFLSDWYSILRGMDDGAAILTRLDKEVFGHD